MIDPTAMVEAIAAQLAATGLNVYPFPDRAYTLDCLTITPVTPFITYDRTFGATGIAEVSFDLEVRLSTAGGLEPAYRRMYQLLGTDNAVSIFDLLRADPTFGGLIHHGLARGVSGPREEMTDRGDELVAVFRITIFERRGP